MRWLTCLALTFWLAATLGQGAVDEQAAMERFQQDHPRAGLFRAEGRITRVYGPDLSVGGSPAESAATFVARYAEMLGVPAGELAPGNHFNDRVTQPVMYDEELGDYRFVLVYLKQACDGVPVYQRELRLLCRNVEGYPLVLAVCNLVSLGDFRVPVGAVDKDPGELGHAEAAAAVAGLAAPGLDAQQIVVPGPVNFGPSQYVIWAGVDGQRPAPRLAVLFEGDNGLEGTSEVGRWEFVADAATGEILHVRNLVIFENVVGNVKGMATPGPAADQCADEIPMAMPYARVYIVNGNTAYADVNGDFVIPHGGSAQVTVKSPVDGTYFDVNTSTELSQQVVPPGPVYFMHNQANNSELLRAEVNGYIQANVVRDFCLAQNPAYPTIANQTNFPVNVNLSSGYCPGNAWYDYSSINFCRASGSYANTAFSMVIHHEYGHHMVSCGGSGQDEYGEGIGDSVGVLITDQSKLAPGFYINDCVNGIRDANNNIQYPCNDEIHYCGQLLSGCIWSTRNELIANYPDTYLDILSNLTVNSILLHTGGSIAPDITIDFLTLDDTDGDIYNGTPHAVEICAGFGAHNMDCPEINFSPIGFTYPDGRPDMVAPGVPTNFRVNVVPLTGQPVPGSGQLHYSLDGGAWVTQDMTELGPNQYRATLPAAHCGSSYRWYVSAEAVGYGTVNDPFQAPTKTYYAPVATGILVLFQDDFETDKGWTVYAGATTGNWERADPQQVQDWWSGTITQPEDDHTPTGTKCYVTGAQAGWSAGDYDVDGGPTRLTSPTLNMPAGGTVSYWRWYHISSNLNDQLVVEASNNDGASWVTVETVSQRETWKYVEWKLGDYVTPSAQVRIRFTASDNPNDSLVEALVDDVLITTLECIEPQYPLGDLNCDHEVDGFDIQPFVLALTDPSAYASQYPNCNYMLADINQDGNVDGFDIQPFVDVLTN